MQQSLGDDVFIGALQYYLQKRQFTSCNHYDLLDDMQEVNILFLFVIGNIHFLLCYVIFKNDNLQVAIIMIC